jgi:hypothetical protein
MNWLKQKLRKVLGIKGYRDMDRLDLMIELAHIALVVENRGWQMYADRGGRSFEVKRVGISQGRFDTTVIPRTLEPSVN